jgi:hypothetical protein
VPLTNHRNPTIDPNDVLIYYPTHDRPRICGPECYNATKPLCHCVCGGANHGKGYGTAQAQSASTVLAIALQRSLPVTITDGWLKLSDQKGDLYARAPL